MIFRHIFTLIMAVAVAITLAIGAGYSANAAAHINNIKTAHNILTASSVIGWVAVAAALVGFGATIFFAEEIMVNAWLRLAVTMGFYAILFTTLLIGILMAYAANVIHGDENYGDNKRPYHLALHGAIVTISISGSLILCYLGVKLYTSMHNHHGSNSLSKGLLGSTQKALSVF